MDVSPAADETQRIEEVRRFRILDTLPEPAFERLTRLAARLFEVPIAIIKLIDADRQWIKSSYGLDSIAAQRGGTLGDQVILGGEVFVVPDASQDARFAANPLVTGETAIRFYAGAPLRTRDGFNVGTFAIMDTAPREMGAAERDALADLAALAVEKMELRLLPGGLHESGQERRAQDLLAQHSEDQFRALIENAADIIGVVEADGTVRYQSPSIEALLGYAPEELSGQNAFDLIHPDDAPRFGEALTRAVQAPDGTFSLEYRFRHRDGSWRHFESVGKTLVGGAPASGVVLSSRDVTERRRSEAALQAAKDQLQIVLDTIPGGVTWVSSDLKYLGVNRYLAEYFKMAAENFIGRPIDFMGIGSDYEAPVRAFFEGASQQTSFEAGLDVNGMRRTMLISGGKYREGRAAVLVGIDITERKVAQAALQQAHDELEMRVAQRTAELAATVETLRGQIAERERAQSALHESELQFRHLMEVLPAAAYTCDAEGLITYFNRQAQELWGRAPRLSDTVDRFCGSFRLFAVDGTPLRHDQSWMAMALQTDSVYHGCEIVIERPDGTRVTALAHTTPILDEAGQVRGAVNILLDISERKIAEEALRDSEARFRQLVAQAADAFFIVDSESRFVEANQQACEGLGYSRQELLGMRVSDIETLSTPQTFEAAWREALSSGGVTREGMHRRKDGTLFPVEVRIGVLEVGGDHLMLTLARDITKRKRAEESLRQSEARKTAILETALDCIISMDHEGKVTEWNPAAEKTFGYERADAVGRQLGELIVPQALRERHYQGIAHYLATGTGPVLGRRIEIPALRADGVEILVELSITAIPTNGPPLFTAYLRDITQRRITEDALKAAKAEAERANLAKSEFLSRMSHELRTPLNAILGFGQLLEMDDLNAEQHQGVEQILRGGRHLLDLINEVLDIARIESEQPLLEIETVPVAEALSGALEMVRPLAERRRITLSGDWSAAQGFCVLADRKRLNQVLLNLLSNAVKYNREGGTATLAATPVANGRFRIAISDSGQGIAPEKIERLWTPFDRLGAERTDIEGTGLGLALTQRLIDAMGGSISVQSTLNVGSTFSFELPLGARSSASGGAAPAEPLSRKLSPPAQPAQTHALVLYIEDNLPNFSLVQNILRHRPKIKLLAATQGRMGVELAVKHRPDLILLDVNLPDIGGEEVLRLLREEPSTRAIPVVAVSADATPQQIERMQFGGALQYLTKPLDVKRFLAMLDDSLPKSVPAWGQGDS